MKTKYLVKAILLMCLIAGGPVKNYSQASRNSLELPPVIIEEKGSIKVRSGGKQDPNKTPRLSSADLDSLNSLEKEKSFLLPTKHLPDRIVYKNYYNGFLKGQFGSLVTPSADFGVGFKAGENNEYDFYVDGGIELSNGPVDNANYEIGHVSLTNVYIAPDKFWIFGGSSTRSNAAYRQKNYNLYALADSVPSRIKRNFDLTVVSDGYYSGVKFETGAGFKSLQLEQEQSNPFDNSIYGFLNIKGDAGDFEVGGKALLDIHSVRGDGLYYAHAEALMNYFVNKFSLQLNLGYQLAENTFNNTRTSLLASALMEYRLNKDLTFKAELKNGLHRNSLYELADINPYLSTIAPVDYRAGQTFKGMAYFHPSPEFVISAGARYGMYENDYYFMNANDGTFLPVYDKTGRLSVISEFNWQFTSEDLLSANFTYNLDKLDTGSVTLPYTSPMNFALSYSRTWFGYIGTQIGAVYVDKRYTDTGNKQQLDAFVNLNVKIEAKLADNFSVFGRFENLLDNNVYIWEGYKERGLFLSGGVLWTFL